MEPADKDNVSGNQEDDTLSDFSTESVDWKKMTSKIRKLEAKLMKNGESNQCHATMLQIGEKFGEIKTQIAVMIKEMKGLKAAKHVEIGAFDGLKKKVEKLSEKNVQMNKEFAEKNSEMNGKIIEKDHQMREIKNDIENLTEENEKLKEDLERKGCAMKEINNGMAEIVEKNQKLKEEIGAFDELKNKVEKLGEENQKLAEENEKIKEEFGKKNAEMEGKIVENDHQIKVLKEVNGKLSEEVKKLKVEMDGMKEFAGKNDKLEKKIAENDQQMREMKEDNGKLSKEMEKLAEGNEKMKKEMEKMKEEFAGKNAMKEKIVEKERQIFELNEINRKLDQEVEKLAEKLVQKGQTMDGLMVQIGVIFLVLFGLKMENREFEGQINGLKEKSEKLVKELGEMKVLNAFKGKFAKLTERIGGTEINLNFAMKRSNWNAADCGSKIAISELGRVAKQSALVFVWNSLRDFLPLPKFNLNSRNPLAAYYEGEIVKKDSKMLEMNDEIVKKNQENLKLNLNLVHDKLDLIRMKLEMDEMLEENQKLKAKIDVKNRKFEEQIGGLEEKNAKLAGDSQEVKEQKVNKGEAHSCHIQLKQPILMMTQT